MEQPALEGLPEHNIKESFRFSDILNDFFLDIDFPKGQMSLMIAIIIHELRVHTHVELYKYNKCNFISICFSDYTKSQFLNDK